MLMRGNAGVVAAVTWNVAELGGCIAGGAAIQRGGAEGVAPPAIHMFQ